MVTTNVTDDVRTQLENVFDEVITVDPLNSNDAVHLALLKRPELGVTFTKLHCWTLTQYSKCVFLDSDMLAVQNADELFEHPELSAVCDIGWPDCFNSGLFVFSPSQDTFSRLLQHAETTGSFDGGDQGLLNTFFTQWNRLSFVYNMVASVTYTYSPAFKQFGKDVKFVHFLGETKPWLQNFESGSVETKPGQEHLSHYLNTWWQIFTSAVQPSLGNSGLASPREGKSDDWGQVIIDKSYLASPTPDSSSPTHHYFTTSSLQQTTPSVNHPQLQKTFMQFDSLIQTPVTSMKVASTPNLPPDSIVSLDTPKGETVTQIPEPQNPKRDKLGHLSHAKVAPKTSSAHKSLEVSDRGRKGQTILSPSLGHPFLPNDKRTRVFPGTKRTATAVPDGDGAAKVTDRLGAFSIGSESLDSRKRRWEEGRPDFMGQDSFDNIKAHIDAKLMENEP